MRAGRLVGRRDAHEALDLQTQLIPDPLQEGVRLQGPNPGLLGLFPGVDLDIEAGEAARPACGLGEGDGQPVPVQGFDDIEEGQGVPDLVGLEGADEAQLEALAATLPPGLGLLDAVLAEDPLPGGDHRGDRLPGLLLGDGGQDNLRRAAARSLRGGGDSG